MKNILNNRERVLMKEFLVDLGQQVELELKFINDQKKKIFAEKFLKNLNDSAYLIEKDIINKDYIIFIMQFNNRIDIYNKDTNKELKNIYNKIKEMYNNAK